MLYQFVRLIKILTKLLSMQKDLRTYYLLRLIVNKLRHTVMCYVAKKVVRNIHCILLQVKFYYSDSASH